MFTDLLHTNQFEIQTIGIYSLLAFGVQVSMRSGSFSLAAIGFYAIGSYAAAYFTTHHQSTVFAIGAGLVISVVVGWLLARLLLRLRDLYLAMATVAFDLLVSVVALNWTSVTGGPLGIYNIPRTVTVEWVLAAVVVVGIGLTLLEAGAGGRIYEAVREDEQLAQTLAIESNAYRRFTFVLSAGLGSLAGALHALSAYAISPGDTGFDTVILILAMVIIGGYTRWFGAVIGAALLVLVPLELSVLGRWWPVVYGVGLLLLAVYAPQGIIGLVRRLSIRLSRALRPVPGTAAAAAP